MTEDNKRYDPRFRTLKRGRVFFNNEYSAMDCQIRDMSSTGSKARLQSYYPLPNKVVLELIDTNGPSVFYDCQLAWQRQNQIGLHYNKKMRRGDDGKFVVLPDPDL